MAKRGFLDGYDTYDTSGGYGNPKQWRKAFHDRFSKEQAEEILQCGDQTPHEVLGLSRKATKVEIKKAYRKLIAEWHPDHNQHRLEEAEEMSKKIIAAYSLLAD